MNNGIFKKPFRVAIEGNVGSGKSTLLKYFENVKNVEVNQEPIETWRDVSGHNLLQLLNTDPHRWSFAFQHTVQLTRLNLQTKLTNMDVQMFERSLQNNRHCYTEMGHDRGILTDPEYEVLCQWYDYIEKHIDIGLDLIVYLRSSPEIVFQRMQRRNRPEERNMKLEYLENLHKYYENWLMKNDKTLPCSLLVIDVNKDLSDNQLVDLYKSYEDKILGETTVK